MKALAPRHEVAPEELATAFEDVVTIARTARLASIGWRAVCVRERRRIGPSFIDPLAALDIDEDAEAVGHAVSQRLRAAPIYVDTLVFGLFDGIDESKGGYAGYYVSGTAGGDLAPEAVAREPRWYPEGRFLESAALDAVVSAAFRARRGPRTLLEHVLRFAAASLISRFAVRAAGFTWAPRVIVAFDDELQERGPAPAPRLAEIVPSSR